MSIAKDLCKTHYRRRHHLQRLQQRYGLTDAQVAALLARTAPCDICGSTEKIAVDHDHITGHMRGLLCTPCNHAIGMMKDNPTRLRAAADYLEAL